MGPRSTAATVALVSLLDAGSAFPADPLPNAAAIKERGARLGELKGLLADKDPSVRVAAFQSMTESQDRAARKLAIDMAITSDDPTLQGLALRYTIGDMNNIVIELDQEALKKEAFKEFVKKYGDRYAINITSFDYGTGKFSGGYVVPVSGGTLRLTGQIGGTAFQFVSSGCSGNFHFDSGSRAEFKGTISCETLPTVQGGFRVR